MLASTYSALKVMGNEPLSEQLNYYKLIEKKEGFKTTGSGPDMRRGRLTLMSLMMRSLMMTVKNPMKMKKNTMSSRDSKFGRWQVESE